MASQTILTPEIIRSLEEGAVLVTGGNRLARGLQHAAAMPPFSERSTEPALSIVEGLTPKSGRITFDRGAMSDTWLSGEQIQVAL